MKKLLLVSIIVAGAAYWYSNCCTKQQEEGFRFPDDQVWGSSKPDNTFKPFTVKFDPKDIDDLKQRLARWRRHEPLPGVGFDYGFAGKELDNLVKYWREKYDFAKAEARLNALPQFTTVINGLNVHFIHAKADPKAKKIMPLLLVHGWPGSIAEFHHAIPLLTKADETGAAFEVVAPSIPGYGFSEASNKPGFTPIAAAQVFHTLMKRLGYSQFVYQGGDWGSIIGAMLSRMYPNSVIGYHSNFPQPPTETVGDQLHLGAALLAPKLLLDEGDVHKLDKLDWKEMLEETGYFHEQATKPDTIGVALSDSPVGVAAWIIEKFIKFTENAEFKGSPAGKGISNDDLLTNVMVYWMSNHITSAGRFYKETIQTHTNMQGWISKPLTVPSGASCYPKEVICAPKALLKRRQPNLVHYVDMPRGGHFAAFEEPQLFADDVRVAAKAFYKARDL